MTCRCPMCGTKNAGKPTRGSYIRAGVRCNEDGVHFGTKKRDGRRLRRRRENLAWKRDLGVAS